MPDWDLPRSPASALLLVQLGQEYDVGPERSLRGAGLTLDQLRDPATEVSADQEMRIVGNLLAAVPDDVALGVEAGTRYHLTTHGIWGFALASSSTLRRAIAVGVRYVDLTFALCRIYRDDAYTPARLVLDGSRVPSGVRRFFVERELASIVHLARQLLSEPDARFRVHFSHPAPPSLAPYEAAFGALPEFDAEATYVELDDAVLDRPLPQADAHAAALAEQQCRELIDQRRARTGVAGKVRDRLLRRPGAMPDIEHVAAELHMSSRTLRRHLTAEGTSYRALVDEVRERLAEELLATGALSVEEIGKQLGYAATPSFTTAFKRWKGVPPRAHLAR